MIALNNVGLVLLNLNQPFEAAQILREGIEVSELLRKGLKDAHKITIFEEQARTYRLLQKALITQNQPEQALEIAERGRARAFVELLAERLSVPAELSSLDSLTFPQIQAIARVQNSTLVEYSILYEAGQESQLLMWVIQTGGAMVYRLVDLKPLQQEGTSLSNLVACTRKALGIQEALLCDEPVTPEDAPKFLRQLHQCLITPILPLLPTDPDARVVLIPQGILFLVPFAALQDPVGKFLIEKHTIRIAPSIQVQGLIQPWSQKIHSYSQEILVVGNPNMPVVPLADPPKPLENLPWAQTEAEAIASFFKTQAITGAKATKANIQPYILQARLVHLATHSLLDDIRQLGIPGSLALAPSQDDDGFLTAGEIYNMQLKAELVVLSACSTGQGKITGDGVVGLSRCLIAAGAKSIVVSLWSVADLSTALMMVKFYQIFQQGVEVAIALKEAQCWLLEVNKVQLETWVKTYAQFFSATLRLDLRRRLHHLEYHAQPFENPRYWAAFCLIGQ